MYQHNILWQQQHHRHSRLPHLDTLHQRRSHGDAQDQDSTKYCDHFMMKIFQKIIQFQVEVELCWTIVTQELELEAVTKIHTVWLEVDPVEVLAMETLETGEYFNQISRKFLICFHSRSSSRDCPPQLPPRDNGIYSGGQLQGPGTLWSNGSSSEEQTRRNKKTEKKKTGDDPYYFGLSARIPNFVKSRKKKQKERNRANNPGQVRIITTILRQIFLQTQTNFDTVDVITSALSITILIVVCGVSLQLWPNIITCTSILVAFQNISG